MPNVFVRNETRETINIAVWFTAPVAFSNSLAPGATWGPAPMASMIYPSFEVRIDRGPQNRFSAGASLATVGTIAGACAAGTASVLAGTATVLGALGGSLFGMARAASGFSGAGLLMQAASAGTYYVLLL